MVAEPCIMQTGLITDRSVSGLIFSFQTHMCLENIWILIATDEALMQIVIAKCLHWWKVSDFFFKFGCQIFLL